MPALAEASPVCAPSRAVAIWLFVCVAMVLVLVVLGGVTRLTRSGLSIVEWKPVTGVLPPLSAAQWQEQYAKYAASPEGRLVNAGMSLDDFKPIFYMEWFHRLLGRLIGLVVLVPLGFFAATKRLTKRRLHWVLGAVVVGGLQGLIGWLMVRSGLEDRPAVSHYCLALHYVTALAILALLLWPALDELGLRCPQSPGGARALAITTLVATLAAIVWGAFMAGLHAGLVAPTFPTMNGAWIPSPLLVPERSLWGNLAENALTVHFLHRLLAYVAFVLAVITAIPLLRTASQRPVRVAAWGLLACAAVQITLGALTVLTYVQITPATLHQLNGALLFAWCLALLHALRGARV